MTAELWQRLKPLYSAALDLPEEGRTGYVEQMCMGDPDLARELYALLEADKSAANTLNPPFADFSIFRPQKPVILEPGTLLAERFRIVHHLGSGGMGDVYEALDLQLERGHIALKTLRPEIARNPDALARFKDEVLLARKITGPNICRIYELYMPGPERGEHAPAFLTMELLEGMTLHDHIDRDSPLAIRDIRGIAEQLCAALCCIHEARITHRDLKPRNVMLVRQGESERAVVMDFGLALASGPTSGLSGSGFAAPTMVAGTPSYMAPEQFEGSEAGPATDIYALGLILYEMATGIQPFAAHTPLAAAIRRSKRPTFASSVRAELPPIWDGIITRCLEYEPAHRFQSASEVLDAIKHPDKVVLRFGKTRRVAVPRITLLSGAIALLLTLAVASWFIVQNAQQRKLSPEAAHWYALGMTALREGSYLKATHLLNEVTRRDPTYAVAHAALADAWTELDFTESAQREMLLASAPDEQRGLSEAQHRYIDAVRTTLVRNYSAAAQDYEAILKKAPQDQKADGYVDLGRIYEKAGKVHETVEAYEKAALLNPDDPAPFLHLGMLRSQLRETDAAAKAFDHAEMLYRAESDTEGMAEVAYQRGYAANETGALAKAEGYLQQSLKLAREIPSEQLEARTLSQLSSVAYWESKDEQAIAYANRAMEIARQNGLEYWSTDGLVRLANAYMDKEDWASAETPAQEAMRLAKQNGHPRLEASAALTLASMRDQQDRWNESIPLAQEALQYYRDYGFMNPADKAETLILRGQRGQGHYVQALQSGRELLDIANRTHSTLSVEIAEELVGTVLLRLERYPEALENFRMALHAAESMGHTTAYQQAHFADTAWHLGRYSEAERALAAIDPEMQRRQDIGARMAMIRADMRASQGDGHGALQIAHDAQIRFADMRNDSDLYRTMVTAELQSGQMDLARKDIAHLVTLQKPVTPQGDIARDHLLQAQFALQSGDFATARSMAETASQVFAANDLKESAALSLLWASLAAQKLGDAAAAGDLSQKSVDIFRQLAQSWGVPAFQTYTKRPDRQQALRTLAQLRGAHGDLPDELSF